VGTGHAACQQGVGGGGQLVAGPQLLSGPPCLLKAIDMPLAATVRYHGEGEQRWFCGGGVFTWKATAQETGGAFLIFKDDLDGGKVTPLHLHPEANEIFYMLEGEILLHIDGRERRLGAGGIAVLPRGVPMRTWLPHPRQGCCASRLPGAARRSTSTPASP